MTRVSLTLFGVIALQLIFGTCAASNNYRLSEDQKTNLRKWKDVINTNKNPCEEFYDFVCSDKEFPVTQHTQVEAKLKNLLNVKRESITNVEEKYLKYSTCERFKQEEKEAFIKTFTIENSIGSWPAFVENWDDSKFNLQEAIAEMNSYNHPVVFIYTLKFDESDNFKITLQIKEREIVDIKLWKSYLKTQFQGLGVRNPDDVLNDAVLFQKTYDEAAQSVESTTDKKIKFSELKDFLPSIDWDKQIEIIFGGKLPDDCSVLLKSHERLKKIYEAIKNLSPKVIANYFFCALVQDTNYLHSPKFLKLFQSVFQQALMKYVYVQTTKETLKEMLVTILKTLQDQNIFHPFETRYSSEQITEYLNEDIFGLMNEEELEKEFRDVSTNSNDCLKNYFRLQKIYNKIQSKPFFNSKNPVTAKVTSQIIVGLVNSLPVVIEEPSPILFQELMIFSVMPTLMENPNMTIFINRMNGCFDKQSLREISREEMETVFVSQVIPKLYAEWAKNYPEIVQKENEVLQEFNLSTEELLIIAMEKYACQPWIHSIITGFANSVEFSQIFNCPVGSKMNVAEKCSFI